MLSLPFRQFYQCGVSARGKPRSGPSITMLGMKARNTFPSTQAKLAGGQAKQYSSTRNMYDVLHV